MEILGHNSIVAATGTATEEAQPMFVWARKFMLRRWGIDTSKPIPMMQMVHIIDGGHIIAISVAVDGPALLLFSTYVRAFAKELLRTGCVTGDTEVVDDVDSFGIILEHPISDAAPFDAAARKVAAEIGLQLVFGPPQQT